MMVKKVRVSAKDLAEVTELSKSGSNKLVSGVTASAPSPPMRSAPPRPR
jgi:hypothetical protein